MCFFFQAGLAGAPPPPPMPGSSLLPANLAADPTRNALIANLKGSGGKRGLRPVPRREKKVSNFMDVLRKEAKGAGADKLSTAPEKSKKRPAGNLIYFFLS